ncbi:MAG: hypothetical protein GY910_04580 [bacterium]|nr:hypothetical protein [Deltaproteobacteria bacterium]MCP4904236.1 hypothetical protein [bacterium]
MDFLTQFGADVALPDPSTSPVSEPYAALLLGLAGLSRRRRRAAWTPSGAPPSIALPFALVEKRLSGAHSPLKSR